MNMEAQDLDSLRRMVRELEEENGRLKEQLNQAGIPYRSWSVFEERVRDEYDPDQGGRIQSCFVSDKMVRQFFGCFWGREDVFAKRGRNGGYFPQCDAWWNASKCPKRRGEKQSCLECASQSWTRLQAWIVKAHLIGSKADGTDVLGIYPLRQDGTCRFIVFDFDHHDQGTYASDYANESDAWRGEVDALRRMCKKSGIHPLVERSRSGRGAHVWILFSEWVPASLARRFGSLLLDKGQLSVNMTNFKYYDRMFPCQDQADGLGNLIALPMQGLALKQGNSAFVDENWNAYPDQWNVLLKKTVKLSRMEIEGFIRQWSAELAQYGAMNLLERPRPWKRDKNFVRSDVTGTLHIVLADGIYVDTLNLCPGIQNQIRSLAAYDNPVYFINRKMKRSNYGQFSSIYLGRDVDGYICLPRGLLGELKDRCVKAGIPFDVTDHREKGRPIRVSFQGKLYEEQDEAAVKMLNQDNGILCAATAFGKTAVGCYLIAKRQVNTLILVDKKMLLQQWVAELNKFLKIDEEIPEYVTPTGRIKKRKSVIGTLEGGKDALTGIVDVAMETSMYSQGRFHDRLGTYGMVIVDECHHSASATRAALLSKVNARYVYGVTATLKRSDHQEASVSMLIGQVQHSYSASQKAMVQGIGHFVIPRFTRVIDVEERKKDFNGLSQMISVNELRNEMILEDVRAAVLKGRTPVLLTKYKKHARVLADHLQGCADHVYLLYGDQTDKENKEVVQKLKAIPREESLILIATGQKVGEGFDLPRLDTMMLCAPVSFEGLVEQYVGRLHRSVPGKTEVYVYDYIDAHIPMFENMYAKRLRTYRRLGYSVITDAQVEKQSVQAIYDSGNYVDVFERDLIEADKRIVICSPLISRDKVDRLVYLVKPRQEAGVFVTVLTNTPQTTLFTDVEYGYEMIRQMQNAGIHVVTREEIAEHFALIDDDLVWHGGMNLLGREDVWDNLMRIKSARVAEELLEITMGESDE